MSEKMDKPMGRGPHGKRRGGPRGGLSNLIPKEEALRRLFDAWTPQPGTETVPLAEAAGRVLAEDLAAMYSIPVVRASSMDGIAFRSEAFRDGTPDTTEWVLGQDYVRADTGDDFSDDYDTVLPIEQVTILPGGGVTLALEEDEEVTPGMNVKPAGSQVQQGDLMGRKGTVLTPLDLGAIGMGGYGQVKVLRRPRVAFVPTGSELVPVGSQLQRGQNFDTNSLMAAQMIRDMGGEPVLRAITRDDLGRLEELLAELLEQADIVILNAGTSKGGEDYCGQLLDKSGALFHGVAAVPGRPMSAAVIQGKPVINISGPALAAFYSLEWMIRPVVCHFLGIPVPQRPKAQAVLTEPFRCPPPMSMLAMFQVSQNPDGGLLATPMARGPKHRAGAMLTANAFYMTVPGEASYEAGDIITLNLLRGGC